MIDLPVSPLMPGWGSALTLLSLFVAAAAGLTAALALRRAGRISRRYEALMTGAEGTDLASALDALGARTAALEARLAALASTAAATEARVRGAVQCVRVLRYSALNDSGGDQSFVVAMLDADGDGVLLSSLASRAGTRVFAKPVRDGRSSYTLTEEEQRVVAEARRGEKDG